MKPFTVPDYFSLYRIVTSPVVVLMLVFGHYYWFIALIIVNLFTDAADGFIARRWKLQTPRGSMLDSVGDIATHILMIAGLFRFQQAFLEQKKIIFIVIFTLFILQLAIAFLRYRKATSFHTYSSKVAFVVLGGFYILLFLWKNIDWLFNLAASLTILSIAEDIALSFMLPKPKEDVKGIYWVRQKK